MDPKLSETQVEGNSTPAPFETVGVTKESPSDLILFTKKVSSRGIESLLDLSDENANLVVQKSDRNIQVKYSEAQLPAKKTSGIPVPIKRLSSASVEKNTCNGIVPAVTTEPADADVKASESNDSKNIFDESEPDYDDDPFDYLDEKVLIQEIESIPASKRGSQVFQNFNEPQEKFVSLYNSPPTSPEYLRLFQLAGIFPSGPNFKEDSSSKWDAKLEALVESIKESRAKNPDLFRDGGNKGRIATREEYFMAQLAMNKGSKAKLTQQAYVEAYLSHPKKFINMEAQTVTNAMSHRPVPNAREKVLTPTVVKIPKRDIDKKSPSPPKQMEIFKKTPPKIIGSTAFSHIEKKSPPERKKIISPEVTGMSTPIECKEDKDTSGLQAIGYRAKHMKNKQEAIKKMRPLLRQASPRKNNMPQYDSRILRLFN